MPVLVSMLRGINVGGRNMIPMEALRTLYAALKLEDARTYLQSGNVVFRTRRRTGADSGKSSRTQSKRNGAFDRPLFCVRHLS
jgi:uncharacterized protein (DUF1697 family)